MLVQVIQYLRGEIGEFCDMLDMRVCNKMMVRGFKGVA